MMAAITAARRGKSVLLLEHMDKPGKKILATGNGKCNFTNENMSPDHFHGNRELVKSVLEKFSQKDTLSFFREIGIFPKEKNGYYYPNSQQAASVVMALSAELNRSRVCLITSCKLQSLIPETYGFSAVTDKGNYRSKNVIAASGLRAAPRLGSDGSVLPILKELGHRFRPILPALCGFFATGMDFKKVSGVRCEAKISLFIDNKKTAEERGELQLTDYGVSGIPVFQLSSLGAGALYNKKKVMLTIDLLPGLSETEIYTELTRRFVRDAGHRSVSESMCGLLNQKLIPEIIKHVGLDVHQDTGKVDESDTKEIAACLHAYSVSLVQIRDFSCAQVCAGGIKTDEIDIKTLQSRIVKGLYFAGELLDADGICGGYNLQWAWSSGFVAGNAVE